MAQTTMTNGAPNDAPKDYKDLTDQVATLKKDLAGITDLLGEIGARRKDETIAAARARAAELRARGEDTLTEAQLRAEDMQEQAYAAIRRQPGTAIGIAVGVGFLVGLLTSRK